MIPKETIDRIFDTVQIEEVVGDFVHLKKRGQNLLGNCPFHNEKTPSFTVSPVKGIYKCFGCGKAGNSVNFIMEHEKFSYPEALRYLAKKYNIEIEDTEALSDEDKELHDKRESLLVLSEYAKKFFIDILWDTEEGKTIGLSYFKERGFREEIIKKFELGFSPDQWDTLTRRALENAYKTEYLEETGLSIHNEERNSYYDRFRGRVMFPIHSLTGRVIAFGGRTLKTDSKSPKYVNSPESEIYHKSNVLYGIFFARKAIREFDTCFLVEGYTDVVSLHQAGVENVVASSGTSLTTEQIRLVARFTKNITILYDGDAAGIKASLRGIDMILEEGLNVKIVLFPEGHDPDSYIREVGSSSFNEYVLSNQKDFILFKTSLLLSEVQNDPVKKAGLIREIVESIAKIPDSIKASVFIKECSVLMEIEERVLLSELNKLRIRKVRKENDLDQTPLPEPELGLVIEQSRISLNDDYQEREIIRLLLNYGTQTNWDLEHPDLTVIQHILDTVKDQNIQFANESYKHIIEIAKDEFEQDRFPDQSFFVNHSDTNVQQSVASVLSNPYQLSGRWIDHDIIVPREDQNLKLSIDNAFDHLLLRKARRLKTEFTDQLKEKHSDEEADILMQKYLNVALLEIELCQKLGIIVTG